MKLYCCFSIYNLYITLVKAMVSGENIDILIGSQMPDYINKVKSIRKLPFVKNIYMFDSLSYKNIKFKNKIDKIINQKKKEKEYIDSQLNINWFIYGENIYLYNDFEILGWYFVDCKIKYHLIEDGCNFFKYFQKYYNIPKSQYTNNIKNVIKNAFNYGHRMYGTSQYVIDIEVNEAKGIVINNKKIIEVPRKLLFYNLNDNQKNILYKVFCTSNIKLDNQKKRLLICTQPLYEDGQLDSLEIQENIYNNIIQKYFKKGFSITIKPHPRDNVDYTNICEKYNCIYIDKYIPSEVLNYNKNIYYDLALSITSTAIESLEFVKERKYLGFEFIEKYKNN